ncbi:MAG: selenium cofactor biosynthesis protein YqeC [Fidelibacterota bacterium]
MLFSNIFHDEVPLSKGACVAFLGGGGKSSLVFKLGKELSLHFDKVLLTSVTKAGPEKSVPLHLIDSNENVDLESKFKAQNPLYLLQKKIRTDKYQGFTVNQLKTFHQYADITLVEADGSRNLPLKAHTDYDPVVPVFSTHVIILIGADAINTRIQDGKVHRPELFCEKWKLTPEEILTPDIIAKVVTHPLGYLSKIPAPVQIVYFINKVSSNNDESRALAAAIKDRSSHSVFYGSVRESWWKE